MTLADRLEWMFVGCMIGFFLGYTFRAVQVFRATPKNERDERGFMRIPLVQDIAIIVALSLTIFAAYTTAKTNDQVKHVVECNKTYLMKNLQADTTRAKYLKLRLTANAKLQRDQSTFLHVLLNQSSSEAERRASTKDYVQSLNAFLKLSSRKSPLAAYPTVEDLDNCLDQ